MQERLTSPAKESAEGASKGVQGRGGFGRAEAELAELRVALEAAQQELEAAKAASKAGEAGKPSGPTPSVSPDLATRPPSGSHVPVAPSPRVPPVPAMKPCKFWFVDQLTFMPVRVIRHTGPAPFSASPRFACPTRFLQMMDRSRKGRCFSGVTCFAVPAVSCDWKLRWHADPLEIA